MRFEFFVSNFKIFTNFLFLWFPYALRGRFAAEWDPEGPKIVFWAPENPIIDSSASSVRQFCEIREKWTPGEAVSEKGADSTDAPIRAETKAKNAFSASETL